MRLAAQYSQALVSMGLFVCAVAIALICEYLRRNNQQLRELAIELQARCEAGEKQHLAILKMLPAPAPAQLRANGRHLLSAPTRVEPQRGQTDHAESTAIAKRAPMQGGCKRVQEKRKLSADALAVIGRGLEMAGNPALKSRPKPTESIPLVETFEPQPLIAKAELERPEAVLPIAEVAKTRSVSTQSKEIASIVRHPGQRTTRVAQIDAGAVSSHLAETDPPKKNWSAMLSKTSTLESEPVAEQIPELVGFQDGRVLLELVKTYGPLTGLIISIGVAGQVTASVHQFVTSLLGVADFGCQTSDDEFLLIYPEEHGASAQRRLNKIAEQLWDFQIRSLGDLEIQFSWGGVAVEQESLFEAVASASDRMHQTRRSRKLITMEPRNTDSIPVRKAV